MTQVTEGTEILPKSNPDYKTIPTFYIDFRYKNPGSETSIPLDLEVFDQGKLFVESTDFMRFTSSVASFSMLIANSQYKGSSNYDDIINWIDNTNLNDQHNFKEEFKNIINQAKNL